MNLSSVIPGANSPRSVNSQLVCLLPVGILNWERGFLIYGTEKPLYGRCHYVLFIFFLFIYLFKINTGLSIKFEVDSDILKVDGYGDRRQSVNK